MIATIREQSSEIAALCRRYGIARLEVFGSAARALDFDSSVSDLDFLVDFSPDAEPTLADVIAVRAALSELLDYPVDLVQRTAVRNPYVAADIDRDREVVYAA